MKKEIEKEIEELRDFYKKLGKRFGEGSSIRIPYGNKLKVAEAKLEGYELAEKEIIKKIEELKKWIKKPDCFCNNGDFKKFCKECKETKAIILDFIKTKKWNFARSNMADLFVELYNEWRKYYRESLIEKIEELLSKIRTEEDLK